MRRASAHDYLELKILQIIGKSVHVDAQHVLRLARSSPKLQVLVNRSSKLQMTAVQHLHTLPKLSTLHISNVELSIATYKHLGKACLSSLADLQLQHTKLQIRNLEWLLPAGWLQHIVRLDLSNNRLEHKHFHLLGQASFSALRCLQVGYNQMNSRSLEALAQGSWWQVLQIFSVRSSHLMADGVQVLCSTASPVLKALDLSGNAIDAAGMSAVANGTWPLLQSLTLDDCSLYGKQGAIGS